MNDTFYYFLNGAYWSVPWFLGLIFIYFIYLLTAKTRIRQKFYFGMALSLIFLAVGSPLTNLTNFGLHSVVMFQQILMLMVVPAMILKALPETLGSKYIFRFFNFSTSESTGSILFLWIIGAIAMWGGHFLSAAILSSKTGLSICGISVAKGLWIEHIPSLLVMGFLLVSGLFFSLPVFHPDPSKRMAHLKSVIFLFTACLSCTLLGLDVAFSASSASLAEAIPVFTVLRNPFPMSLRADQELAGMLMWVPGCIFYVVSSMGILLHWYDEAEMVPDNQ